MMLEADTIVEILARRVDADGPGGEQKLAERARSAEQSAPKIAKLLKLITLAQRGTADVAIEFAVPEAELPTLLPAFDKLF